MVIRYSKEMQKSIVEARSTLWKEFDLLNEPNIYLQWMQDYDDRTYIEEAYRAAPSVVLEAQEIIPEPYYYFYSGELVGKYMHNIVNPQLYANQTYLVNYLAYYLYEKYYNTNKYSTDKNYSESEEKIREIVIPASSMRVFVGSSAGFMYTIKKNEHIKKDIVDNATEFIDALIVQSEDKLPHEFARRHNEAILCGLAVAYGNVAPLSEIAREKASEYERYAKECKEWIKSF